MSRAITKPTTDVVLYAGAKKAIDELIDGQNEDFVYSKVVIPMPITADASAGKEFTVPFDMVITDVSAYCTATVTSATAKLRRGTTDISGAAVMATVNTKTSTTIVDAQKALTKGETVNVITASANDRGILYVEGYRV